MKSAMRPQSLYSSDIRAGARWDGANFGSKKFKTASKRNSETELIQMQNTGSSAEECPAVRLKGPSTLWALLD